MEDRDYILSHMSPIELADARAAGIELTPAQEQRLAAYQTRRQELAAVPIYPEILHEELKRRAS